jgi:hypothetical protein
MTVSLTSRYRPLGVVEAAGADGRLHPTVPIRRLDQSTALPGAYKHRVTGAEDIEYLSWRLFGASDAWWRIADANPVRFPLDLRPGDAVAMPSKEEFGRIVDRSRVF